MRADVAMTVFFFSPRSLWAVQWQENGKRRRRYFKTEGEARAFEAESMAAMATADGSLTLGELVSLFYRSNPDAHEKTKRNVIYFLAGHEKKGKHIEGAGEFLRDKYADKLCRQDLEQMREAMRGRRAGNNTINKYQAYISAILAWGADQELIARHPWRDFKRLPVKKPLILTTINDIRRVYAHAPDWLQWAIKTTFALSLRPGQTELLSLMWNAFDWQRGIVFVRQGKSGSIKTVFPPTVYMDEARERCLEDTTAGIPLVCHRAGRRVLDYRTAWNKAVKMAGLPHFPMYNIRHVSASEALAHGADLAAVSAQLGHSSVATTGSVYSHATPGSQKRAAALLPALEDKKPSK